MPETPFKLYPRGFLGRVLEGHIEKQTRSKESVLGFHDFRALVLKDRNGVDHSNADVEGLYSQYIRNAAPVNSFEFREKVLIVALSAFGTPRFDFWFQMQLKSPTAGDLHQRFLDDTLKFITEGRREMSNETWTAILTPEDNGDRSGKLSEAANIFFGFNSNGINRYPKNRTLTEVIQQWCSQPNGFEDLLCTLHVLFGKD